MAIRIRTVNGLRVALCAAETDAMPGDVYLDDSAHYALAAKFSRDWAGDVAGWPYPAEWAAMDTQKVRDAVEELHKFLGAKEDKFVSRSEQINALTTMERSMNLDRVSIVDGPYMSNPMNAPGGLYMLVRSLDGARFCSCLLCS